jgi:hypothetical protein
MGPLSRRSFAEWVENKQLVVGCRWTEERIQIDDDLGRKRSGAGGGNSKIFAKRGNSDVKPLLKLV